LSGCRLENSSRNFSFGPFELHSRSRELYKHGVRLKLRPQPFHILNELLNRSEELVTREELRDRLWSSDTFVDFEQSLNTSIKELRAVLGDSAAEPRYVETVPRLGYRFIAKAEIMEAAAANGNSANGKTSVDAALAEVPGLTNGGRQRLGNDGDLQLAEEEEARQSEAGKPARRATRRWQPGHIAKVFTVGGAVLLAGLIIFRLLSPLPPPRVLQITQLTHLGHVEPSGGITTDGARIFFLRKDPDRFRLMQMSVSGGELQPYPSPLENARLPDISPDRSEFLVQTAASSSSGDPELWLLPAVGGSPRRLSSLSGSDAIFSPDGRKIAYSRVDGIYVCDRNGSNAHKLVSLLGSSWGLAWSPDGKVIRFTLNDDEKYYESSLWEVSKDGSNLHPLFPERRAPQFDCCGQWSADGRYYFFTSNKGDPNVGIGSVWARREKGILSGWFKPGAPVRLSVAPISLGPVRPSADPRRFFIVGIANEQNELLRGSRDKLSFSSIFSSTDGRAASISPKGDWLAVVLGDWTLWRSRPDGTERTELAIDLPAYKDVPRWSPDGHWIVFQGRKDGHPTNIYRVSADGGPSEELLPNDQRHETPDWSPDGESIVYSVPRGNDAEPKEASGFFVLNLNSRKAVRIPASEGMTDPQFSSDGRYFVGFIGGEKSSMMVFDFQTRRWKTVAQGSNFYRLRKSTDGKYFYFQEIPSPGEPLYRMHVGDWKVEKVMSFESMLQGNVVRCRFAEVMPDGSPMVIAVRGGYEIYSIDLDLP
jgi:Tol biopolymer transport system component/DNA-binding winged helix-turn-helix (wHTH) protein